MQARAGLAAGISALRKDGFVQSFGLLDIVFIGLAIATAFKIASSERQG